MIFGMNKELYKKLCINFNKHPSKDVYQLWDEELKIYKKDEIEKAVTSIIRNDEYMPSLGRIIEEIKVGQGNYIPNNKSVANGRKITAKPEWFDKEFEEEEDIDEETQRVYDDFMEFLKEFREWNR